MPIKTFMDTITKRPWPGRWAFENAVEGGIKLRLGRSVLLDQLSDTDLEKLWYLIKHESETSLTKTLDEILDL